jgi:hypothetical protein
VLKKADGLSEEQLRRVLVDSGTSILGLVQHLAEVERYWFGYHLAGGAWDADHGMAVPPGRAAADVLAGYRAAIEDSDRAIRAAGDPQARSPSRSTATGTRCGGSSPSDATVVADGSHRLLLAQPGAGAERLVEAVRLERLADLGDHLDLACE